MWHRKAGIERHFEALARIDALRKELSKLELDAGIPSGRDYLYPSVVDAETRARLIKTAGEIENLVYEDARAETLEARRTLDKAQKVGRYWHLWTAVEGVVLVIVGYKLYDLPGSIAGAVAAFFLGRGTEEAYRRHRRTAIVAALDDLKTRTERFEDLTAKRNP